MLPYKKAIVALDGVSAKITDKNILANIRLALSCLHIPMEIYKPHNDGFVKLKSDMNQDDVLYIINDSLQYHLCEKPNILITRNPCWVQSLPKPNTIGIFIQQVLTNDAIQLISCISRNMPVRQPYDQITAPKNYILFNEYKTQDTSAMGRNGLASFTWSVIAQDDIHTELLMHNCEGWPLVNDILKEGISCFSHPDDILIFLNRDICLVPEAMAIIRNFMDTNNFDACYARRVDLHAMSILTYKNLLGGKEYEGIDVFAFRPNASCIEELLNVNLQLGRVAWDSFWADKIKNKLPYKICYHIPHESKWQTNEGVDGNTFNYISISDNQGEGVMGFEEYEEYFSNLK
jgi:hypothetical protein